ncbi:HEPN domain-containing protein [Bartonella sp. HY329]|uniref:HEPN domain-containing protein n=1 Tax=unclassified Bartonella TaxID=2645622 RepID=UPI0021C8864E|nr:MULTISPECIES: HEPN domain-containing protein [unclassified Bartonella]UXM94950.1 HEPN domain-containing protein [Bartonella sp. HY329]UXN09273.1 HEPN domain-containing protein [Bartonella sp. HY328]
MFRLDLNQHFIKPFELARHINDFVPYDLNPKHYSSVKKFRAASFKAEILRSELAGLLLISVCASYENCIKMIMHDYADKVGTTFSRYIERRYENLSSRIRLHQLNELCQSFGDEIVYTFKDEIKKKKQKYILKGIALEGQYHELLNLRNNYAHTATHKFKLTIEDIMKKHRIGIQVIVAFNKSFHCHKLRL